MPSLYEFTTPVGDVASGDFTTLYNASGLTVPNAGAGSVSGNLNVGGNLTVQGSSLLIGPVALQNTLSLPNYTFPSNDGTTYQVLSTDGSGNLYWTNVQAIPGATYAIQADTATGGANLSLVSAFTTDSVKFAGGTNITVSRTDASTITISSSADDIPDGTAQGQVLVWDGSAWTANNLVTSLTVADRFIAELKNNTATTGVVSSFRRNFGSTAYSTGFGSVIGFQFDSDSQAAVTVGSVGYTYDASNPSFEAFTSTDNFVTRTQISKINSTNVEFNGTNLYLNANHTGAPSANATINVERGSSTDASLTWNESVDQWEFTNNLFVQGNYGQNGDSMQINADNTNVDSNLYFKGTSQYLRWNNTLQRFEFSDSLFTSTANEPPAQFERRVTSSQVNTSGETFNALRLTERVTDAVSNATDQGGSNILFSRASGVSGGAEVLYSNIGSRYYGTTNTADIVLQWSNDNFAEPSPGVFPGTFTLLRAGSSTANFQNNSIYINYTTNGAAQIGINTGSPAYTLDVNGNAHVDTDLTVDGDIYISGYQVDINSPVKGDLILFDGTKFVNDNVVQFDSTAARTRFQSNIAAASGTIQSGLIAVKNTGATNYTTGDGSGVLIAVKDDTNPINIFAGLSAAYSSTGNHEARLRSSTDAFATVDKNLLAVNDDDLKVRATEFILNAEGTGSAAVDAQITVERGTSPGADSYLKWNEDLNPANNKWEFSNTLAVGGDLRASDNLYLNTDQNAADVSIFFGTAASATAKTLRFDVSTDLFYFTDTVSVEGTVLASENVVINRDFSDANAVVVFRKPTSGQETIQWNKTIGRFELTTDMYVPQATIGNIDIDRTNGTITTNTGNLTIDSAGGTVAINDNLNVDSGVLYVDAANNRVGVNTVTPGVELQVGGVIWGNSVIAVNGDLGTNGNNIYFNYDNGGSGATSDLVVRRGSPTSGNPDVSVRWNESTDRWQTTTDGTTYLNLPNQNLDTTDAVAFSQVTLDSTATYNTETTTLSGPPTAQNISSTTRTTQKVVITITDNITNHMHVLEALAFQHSGTAYLTTYGEMYTNAALATFTAQVVGGAIEIFALPASTNSTTFKVARVSVD